MPRRGRTMCRSLTSFRSATILCIILVGFYFAVKLYGAYYVGGVARITPDVPFAAQERGSQRFIHAIVLDAGSTGTRVHVYRFINQKYVANVDSLAAPVGIAQVDPEKGPSPPRGPFMHGVQPESKVISVRSEGGLQLIDELFREVKPGLSAFSNDPQEAADSVEPLLVLAKNFIPQDAWSRVPVALYATAGLRLLSESVAQSILDETSKLLQDYPFQLCEDCVRILDGVDEGVFAWYSINYLLGLTDSIQQEQDEHLKLNDKHDKLYRKGGRKHSVGVMDLGGASLQITFLAHDDDAPADFLYETDKFGGQPIKVYTHSYLGLGLNAARMQLLKPMTKKSADSSKKRGRKALKRSRRDLSHQKPEAVGEEDAASNLTMTMKKQDKQVEIVPLKDVDYSSPCLFDGYSGIFRFQNYDVKVRGLVRSTKESADRFEACYNSARELVTSDQFNIHKPREVRIIPFYLQSYFFDRAVDAGLINQHDGGSVTLSEFEQAAKSSCNLPKQTDKLPFMCMDLCFIVALLRDGLDFDPSSNLMSMKTIQNVELSWTLGAAFPLISQLVH